MKVLIIDDDPDALGIAKACLARDGMDVACAVDGKSGLVLVEQFEPDVILLDVSMPGASGYEICLTLKDDPKTCMIPVVFVTAHDTIREKIGGLDLGAVDYVAKPFNLLELAARVRAALRTKRLQDLLIRYAQIDPLTGLWSRRALTDRLGQEWARTEREGGAVACVMTDIDGFKAINDSFGHHVGDRVLCAVADILRAQCRKSDLAARWGGDEFAILLPGQRVSGAARLAKRCRKNIEETSLQSDGKDVRVTASFGVADTVGISSQQALLELADAALYEAKNGGRNRVEIAAVACAAS